MWDYFKPIAAVALSILLFTILSTSCAKNIGQDNVVEVAATLQDVSEFLTVQGIRILESNAPEYVEDVKGDLGEIVLISQFYLDGKVDVGDVSSTIIRVLDRINERFHVIESSNTDLIIGAIQLLSRMVSRYIISAALPEEAALYITSFAVGIDNGLRELATE